MNTDGTNGSNLTQGGYPSFSHDGLKIVFSDDGDIYVINTDGTDRIKLTNKPSEETFYFEPKFSRDGTKIVFSNTGEGLFVMNSDGTNLEHISDSAHQAEFSSDGSKILYRCFGNICLMDADGTNSVNLTNDVGGNHYPTFSPDGTKIAFTGKGFPAIGLMDEIFVMNADGTNRTRLTFNGVVDWRPSWGGDPADTDLDGILNSVDNCPTTPNADQQDTNDDGVGDVCTPILGLGPANIWVGLKNSDDVGIRFDLRAEAYRGLTLVGSGELASAHGGSSGFNNARLNSIVMTPVEGTIISPGETLNFKLLVRNACTGSGKNSGRARLWFNDAAANSSFDATIGSAATYYLKSNDLLATSAGSGPRATVDIQAGSKCSTYKTFGTWSMTLP